MTTKIRETVPALNEAPETPTDEVDPPKAKARPARANRFQLFDDGEGDYRIYQIAPAESGMPKGSLMPIAGVPGFRDGQLARKFINNSGNLFQGKQLMILKGLEICFVEVQTITKVGVKFKPRKAVTGPAASGGEDGQ